MKRGQQRNKETKKQRNKHTLRQLDQPGPEGRVGENPLCIPFEGKVNVLSSNRKNNTQVGRDPTIQNTSIVLICNAANGFTLYSLVAVYYLLIYSPTYYNAGL